MSNPGGVKKRMYVILTQLRMKGTITKRDWDLFKQVIETGVKTLFSVKSDKLEEIRELLRTAPVPPEEIPDEIMKILGPSIDSDKARSNADIVREAVALSDELRESIKSDSLRINDIPEETKNEN